MRSDCPTWLTKEFIQNVLQEGKEYTVTVERMEIDMPVPKGENYECDIFGAIIEYRKSDNLEQLNEVSLIIKVLLKGKNYEEIIKNGTMQKEIIIYNEFSKKLNQVFGCSDNTHDLLLPKSYFTVVKDAILLEDLKTIGYKLADRRNQLDFDHSVVALTGLAKFHAGSVIIHKSEAEFIANTVGNDVIYKFNSPLESCTKSCFKLFAQALDDLPDLKKYSKWFEENSERSWKDFVIGTVGSKENELNVLNHGDFWSSNMLFRYDENNKPVQVKLIDFQECRYTSPVIDFIYFLDSSVQETVRLEHFDDLIRIYLNELNTNLDKYGSLKRLDEFEFKQSYKERSMYRVNVIVMLLPFVVADPNSVELLDMKETSFDDLGTTERNPMKNYYKDKKYIKIISKFLPEFEKIGLITATH